MADTLREIITEREHLRAELAQRQAAHATFLKVSASRLASLDEAEALIVGGIDYAKIERARQVITIEGQLSKIVRAAGYMRAAEPRAREGAWADARADLAAGGHKIVTEYFGVKTYSGFGDQRHDGPYFTGPRHGSIVFSIGLAYARRQRIEDEPLTTEEIADALYLLSALPSIETIKQAA